MSTSNRPSMVITWVLIATTCDDRSAFLCVKSATWELRTDVCTRKASFSHREAFKHSRLTQAIAGSKAEGDSKTPPAGEIIDRGVTGIAGESVCERSWQTKRHGRMSTLR